MKYRTVIEIITNAENENDAMDIAGEFLRSDLETGVQMKCYTKPIRSYLLLKTGFLLTLFSVFIFIIGMLSFRYFKSSTISFTGIKNTNAITPPLKTNQADKFKETWKEEENKKALEYIKNK